MSQVVIPLDPDGEHGKAIAARLSRTLAVIERELQEARAAGRQPDRPLERAA